MRKGIKITEQLKRDNPDVFGNRIVDKIYELRLPEIFNRGGNLVLGYQLREDLQREDGWREVIKPPFDKATQKLGEIIENENNEYLYEIIKLTSEETDEEERNEAREQLDRHMDSGNRYIIRTKAKIWRRVNKFRNGEFGLTRVQAGKVNRWLTEVYFQLTIGDFREARRLINNLVNQRGEAGDNSLNETVGMMDTVVFLQGLIIEYFENDYDM